MPTAITKGNEDPEETDGGGGKRYTSSTEMPRAPPVGGKRPAAAENSRDGGDNDGDSNTTAAAATAASPGPVGKSNETSAADTPWHRLPSSSPGGATADEPHDPDAHTRRLAALNQYLRNDICGGDADAALRLVEHLGLNLRHAFASGGDSALRSLAAEDRARRRRSTVVEGEGEEVARRLAVLRRYLRTEFCKADADAALLVVDHLDQSLRSAFASSDAPAGSEGAGEDLGEGDRTTSTSQAALVHLEDRYASLVDDAPPLVASIDALDADITYSYERLKTRIRRRKRALEFGPVAPRVRAVLNERRRGEAGATIRDVERIRGRLLAAQCELERTERAVEAAAAKATGGRGADEAEEAEVAGQQHAKGRGSDNTSTDNGGGGGVTPVGVYRNNDPDMSFANLLHDADSSEQAKRLCFSIGKPNLDRLITTGIPSGRLLLAIIEHKGADDVGRELMRRVYRTITGVESRKPTRVEGWARLIREEFQRGGRDENGEQSPQDRIENVEGSTKELEKEVREKLDPTERAWTAFRGENAARVAELRKKREEANARKKLLESVVCENCGSKSCAFDGGGTAVTTTTPSQSTRSTSRTPSNSSSSSSPVKKPSRGKRDRSHTDDGDDNYNDNQPSTRIPSNGSSSKRSKFSPSKKSTRGKQQHANDSEDKNVDDDDTYDDRISPDLGIDFVRLLSYKTASARSGGPKPDLPRDTLLKCVDAGVMSGSDLCRVWENRKKNAGGRKRMEKLRERLRGRESTRDKTIEVWVKKVEEEMKRRKERAQEMGTEEEESSEEEESAEEEVSCEEEAEEEESSEEDAEEEDSSDKDADQGSDSEESRSVQATSQRGSPRTVKAPAAAKKKPSGMSPLPVAEPTTKKDDTPVVAPKPRVGRPSGSRNRPRNARRPHPADLDPAAAAATHAAAAALARGGDGEAAESAATAAVALYRASEKAAAYGPGRHAVPGSGAGVARALAAAQAARYAAAAQRPTPMTPTPAVPTQNFAAALPAHEVAALHLAQQQARLAQAVALAGGWDHFVLAASLATGGGGGPGMAKKARMTDSASSEKEAVSADRVEAQDGDGEEAPKLRSDPDPSTTPCADEEDLKPLASTTATAEVDTASKSNGDAQEVVRAAMADPKTTTALGSKEGEPFSEATAAIADGANGTSEAPFEGGDETPSTAKKLAATATAAAKSDPPPAQLPSVSDDSCVICGRSKKKHKDASRFGSSCDNDTCGKCGITVGEHTARGAVMGAPCGLGKL